MRFSKQQRPQPAQAYEKGASLTFLVLLHVPTRSGRARSALFGLLDLELHLARADERILLGVTLELH